MAFRFVFAIFFGGKIALDKNYWKLEREVYRVRQVSGKSKEEFTARKGKSRLRR